VVIKVVFTVGCCMIINPADRHQGDRSRRDGTRPSRDWPPGRGVTSAEADDRLAIGKNAWRFYFGGAT
jgi:hypothetical protein